jgi:hypothetical protein
MNRRHGSLVILVLLVTLAAGTVSLAATQGPRSLTSTIDDAISGDRFSLVDFEIETVLNKWVGEAGAFIAGRRDSGPAADRVLERYFNLQQEIVQLDASADRELIEDLRHERDRLENRAERILESRIAAALRDAGLSRPLPLFGAQSLLWPPVDVELTRPPRVLVVSPRDEIRLVRDVLLRPDLSLDEIRAIEEAVEADGRFSALVDTLGGVAVFPAIIRDTRSFPSTVTTIAHEWTHHYLFFYRLGRSFFDSQESRTINETVADIVAAEIDDLVFAASPPLDLPPPPPNNRDATDPLLFQLRVDVDALLAAGDVAQAEALMETVRLQLAEQGRSFRRLNQAFFAFNGVYATTAASSSPIGPMLQQLRLRSDSLADFVAKVRTITTSAELEALLRDG